MKRMCAVVVVAVVTAFTLGALAPEAGAGDVVWQTKQIKWAGSTPDTTYLTDETDTTRTVAVRTDDWAWDVFAPIAAASTGSFPVATLTFESTSSIAPVATDTIYYRIEKGINGKFARNNTLTAAVGSCAILPGLGGDRRVWVGQIIGDLDTPGSGDAMVTPEFRLVVMGDQSGSSPVVQALKVYITYPKRAASR